MTTSLIVVTTTDEAEAAASRAWDGDTGSRVRRFVPVAGPPGEYPDTGAGDVRAVWVVEGPGATDRQTARALPSADAYLVDSAVQWDEPDTDESRPETPMRFAFIVARRDLDRGEFVRRWRAHAAVARAHQPDFRRYVQHVVGGRLSPSCGPFAGIGEFGFRRLGPGEGVRRFADAEGQVAVEADIAGFLEPSGGRNLWVEPAR